MIKNIRQLESKSVTLLESAEFHAFLEMKEVVLDWNQYWSCKLSVSILHVGSKTHWKAKYVLKVGKPPYLGPLHPALYQLSLYQDSGLVPPTQRSDLSFPFTHSLSTYVSVPTMCQVPCCRLDFTKTSLYLVSVIVPLISLAPEQIWCTSMQINECSFLIFWQEEQVHQPMCIGLRNWREMEKFSN